MKLQQWAHWAEIFSSVAVVVSLVFLTIQIGENTLPLEREELRDRATQMTEPYLNGSPMPETLSKVKAVDGPEPVEQAFIERYGMTYAEAAIHARHLVQVWSGLEADYVRNGVSQALQDRIQFLLIYPDNQIMWDMGQGMISEEFEEYVARVRQLPLPASINNYRDELQRLKELQTGRE